MCAIINYSIHQLEPTTLFFLVKFIFYDDGWSDSLKSEQAFSFPVLV